MKKSVRQKKVPLWQQAYLEDRVRVNRGKPQLYGTQFRLNKKRVLVMWPVQNRIRLNIRRKQAGLEPIGVYKKELQSRQLALKERW
ncbi:MAG: hypothetical protein UV57_C0009G0021 [Parcubacteria group bacterium GW2011_GWD2_43_10]|uniref:Uncharacterized protein n=1 Tax=Candidatus Veblenbacteria bacterium RIFOXYA2_FULL_43_9 TaxID=1802425 RepID=A0A1G2Q103_9BACT|nr:MAG: hypothetical protein UV57_C0009G0021 [Parcubacteria group bacterium GW2011_GWD2_43_10]KKT25615.1 MAG: hypothetical protein UW12_C0045G0005 [Parcubacteria group bacterium GW2011_GWF1_43_9]OHA54260.1 MAG: hypothetical protein A2226_03575 [Candidatus Veblenbacteria bacterium RIFOXYA2_FULL_43_9]HBH17020.1 hypothetical protein [Candidatus Veblenbacteria bacterium]HBZ36246.1 hypothetical protein [Candidatus Veblenbacteria bacterium]